jgi:hypothetical protein
MAGLMDYIRQADKSSFEYVQDLVSDARQLYGKERYVEDRPDNTFLDPYIEPELDIMTDSVTGKPVVETLETVAEEQPKEKVEAPLTPEKAIDKVEAVFPSNGILMEIAKVESRLGQDKNTYRKGYHGGVMQVDKVGYESTKDLKSHPKLKEKFKAIESEFGIKWPDTKWEDLRDPLHSVIAARLFLSNIEKEIPSTKKARASYWKDNYNTSSGKGTVAKYLERIK